MTTFSRAWLSACAALCLSLLSGCDDSPDPGTADAGAWDGTYTVLEERGDHTEDPGVLAPCTYTLPAGTASAGCPTPEQFHLTACDRATLSTLPSDAIYRFRVRQEVPLADGTVRGSAFVSGVQLSADGGSTLTGQPLTTAVKNGQDLFLGRDALQTDGGTNNVMFAGCQASGPDRFNGCYARCVNGRVFRVGTFDAYRMTWQPGEAESSGGLGLVSESFVAQGLPVDVYVAKNHAYVVSVRYTTRGSRDGGLTVFDVSDRRNPVL
ncbi:MAG TPA: hypothetical protein VE153_17405, partial [Myxococcus sp.]|nr:hypothetical protein [Myxococcus sp.]